MACRLLGDNQLSEPMMIYDQLDSREHIFINFVWNSRVFIQENSYENVVTKNGGHFDAASMCWIWRAYMECQRRQNPIIMDLHNP